MPVNDNSLSVEFVCELHMNYISSYSSDCWTGELTIDSHHNIFYSIWRPVHVRHFPFVKLASSLIRSSQWTLDHIKQNTPDNETLETSWKWLSQEVACQRPHFLLLNSQKDSVVVDVWWMPRYWYLLDDLWLSWCSVMLIFIVGVKGSPLIWTEPCFFFSFTDHMIISK